MILAHRIQLEPNNVQRTYFAKASGVARFAYNWALGEWNRLYEPPPCTFRHGHELL